MKKWSPKQRMLVGALALASAGWAVDALTRGGPPPAAQAASSASEAPAPPSETEDSAQLVERLLCGRYVPAATDLEQLQRDLFVPSALMQALALPEPEPEPRIENDEQGLPAPAFQDQHVLTGVIIGHVPLAQVDQGLLPLGAVLDGHTLVEIQRDYVIFENRDSRERVTLELKRRSGGSGQTP